MLYLVNGPPKGGRKGKRKRTAKQRAATKKMLAARKRATASRSTSSARTTKRSTSMARKAKRSGASRKRRRSSAKRRGAGVRLVRRGTTVYQGNPKRRRARGGRRYHRNPGILSGIKQQVMDAGATLVGGAAARAITGFVPLPDGGVMGFAKSALVAVGVGIGARKVVSSDTARFIAAGAMQVALKNAITSFVPAAGAFLGEYDGVQGYVEDQNPAVSGYVTGGALYEGVGEYESAMGAYL